MADMQWSLRLEIIRIDGLMARNQMVSYILCIVLIGCELCGEIMDTLWRWLMTCIGQSPGIRFAGKV
jgi:hypothetical protein